MLGTVAETQTVLDRANRGDAGSEAHAEGNAAAGGGGAIIIVKDFGRCSSNAWGYSEREEMAFSAGEGLTTVGELASACMRRKRSALVCFRFEGLYLVPRHLIASCDKRHGIPPDARGCRLDREAQPLADLDLSVSCLVMISDTLVPGMEGGKPTGDYNSSLC